MEFEVIDRKEIPGASSSRRTKWMDVVEKVMRLPAGKALQFKLPEEYKSFSNVRSRIIDAGDRRGMKLIVTYDTETRMIYVDRAIKEK